MAPWAVDAGGKRIKTNILVSGYVREGGEEYKLLIPADVNCICFAFWLIKVCDEWDEELSGNNIKFDGQIAKCLRKRYTAIYGCHSIDKGSHSWRIKFKSDIYRVYIGVLEDDKNILTQFRNIKSIWDVTAHGCFLGNSGDFYHNDYNTEYILNSQYWLDEHEFTSKETIIEMTLNMDEHSIRFKIADGDYIEYGCIDYGIATDELKEGVYRLAVYLYDKDRAVELL